MRTTSFLAAAAAAALLALPGVAVAGGRPDGNPSAGNHPGATSKPKGKAYGKYCQGQSKKHVKGEKGTPFSRCVTAMAKLQSGEAASPKAACKTLSKKHVKGQKGTPYSRCIVAAAQLLKDKHADEEAAETTAPAGSTTS